MKPSVDLEERLYRRVRYLPVAIDNTRAKLKRLETEARSLGLKDCLNSPATLNRAWDREVEIAKLGNQE